MKNGKAPPLGGFVVPAASPLRDHLVAGHRFAEPAYDRVLVELALRPLLDLPLRLGEASGAALALPLIGRAARLDAVTSGLQSGCKVQTVANGEDADRAGRQFGVTRPFMRQTTTCGELRIGVRVMRDCHRGRVS